MNTNIDAALAALASHALVKRMDSTPTGRHRIQTIFKYPDGSWIDVFLMTRDDLFKPPYLSDLGQTMAWLLDLPVRPWQSKKRQTILEDIVRAYGVQQDGGALVKVIENENDLAPDIVALSQACVRVADLMFTKRSTLSNSFVDEVEELLVDLDVPFESGVELQGFNNVVRVDFLVSARRPTAIIALGARQSQQAHSSANEIFRRWYDLNKAKRPEERVTVVDDSQDVYRTEDLDRLADLSSVVSLSDKDALAALLAA